MIKGKIYKIYSICDDVNEIYYGSTIQPLSNRMGGHRRDYKGWEDDKTKKYYSSFELFDKYGIDKFIIELVESVECNTKEELRAREGFYIKNNECVNKNIAGRSMKEYLKEYRDIHKEQISEQQKPYQKEYRNIHKELIKEKYRQIYKCECGSYIQVGKKHRHFKTKKHINAIHSKSLSAQKDN